MARLANLPLQDFAENQIRCVLVVLACELTAWMQMLALTGTDARRREPTKGRRSSDGQPGRQSVLRFRFGHYFACAATFRSRNPERPRRIPSEASTTVAKT